MNWQEKSIIKSKDTIVSLTPQILEEIKEQEKAEALERDAANLRVLEFHRKKDAKAKGIPYVSLADEEKYKKETDQKLALEKEQRKSKFSIPEIWKLISDFKLNITGKIDLEELNKKNLPNKLKEDSIFSNEKFNDLYKESLSILNDVEIDEKYVEDMLKDFIHLYNIDEITRDIEKIIEKEQRIKNLDTPERKKTKKMATILEAILIDGITNYDWLGKKIKIVPPNKFDELFKGFDGVIEFNNSEKINDFLALGIDVSFRSVDGDLFEEKVNNLLNNINNDELTQVKYFKDNNGEAIENLSIPKIVISIDAKTLEQIMLIWSKKNDINYKDKFKNHTIAIDIIGQIADQCKILAKYANDIGAKNVAKRYNEIFDLLLKISEEIPKTKAIISQADNNKFVNKIKELINKRIKNRYKQIAA